MTCLHVVLVHPDIPQNTGNIGRLCAFTQTRLHLIHPCGFVISDSKLKRSGMDYWHQLDVHHHNSLEDFFNSPLAPQRLWLLTTHATRSFWDVTYKLGDGLVFGSETKGLPSVLHQQYLQQRLKIDAKNATLRSLNLATSVGIVTYEALRQLRAQAA